MDFPGRLIAALLAIILVLLFPLQYIAKASESNTDSYISDCTEQFTDVIRNKGYLEVSVYEAYVRTLDASGELYDLEIEDIHPVTGEEVALYEEDDEDNVSLTSNYNENSNYKDNKYMDNNYKDSNYIDNYYNASSLSINNLFVNWNNSLQLAMNGSIGKIDLSLPKMNQNDEIQSFSAHVHTPDCYVGHNHEASGCFIGYVCHEGSYLTIDMSFEGDVTYFNLRCSACGKIVARVYRVPGYSTASYHACFGAVSTYKTTYGTYELVSTEGFLYSDGSTRGGDSPWCIDYFNAIQNYYFGSVRTIGYQQLYTSFPQFIRTLPYGYNSGRIITTPPVSCPYENDPNPICNQVVTSITPTNPSQTVKLGENIITTALATYLDGHTGYVNCTSNYNAYVGGTQTVTLAYSGLVGNARTYGTRTCTINVTVISKTLQYIVATPASQVIPRYGAMSLTVTAFYSDCTSVPVSYGQYELSNYSTAQIGGPQTISVYYRDGGITRSTTVNLYVDYVTSITVTPNDLSVYKYTESIPATITANYLYSGSKVLTGGVTASGYTPSLIGNQVVTFYYTENDITVSATAMVRVLPYYKICSVCGNLYYMNADDTDPGCPYCKDIITGIEVSPEDIEILQGEALPVTVKAIYKNEISKTVYGWTSDFNTNIIGLQLVTVRYGAFEEKIYVTVKERGILCPICGNTYLSSEGSCPVCREKVVGISVAPGALTVEQYGSIDLEVIATYADGSTKPVTDWSVDCTTAKPGVYKALVTYHNYSAEIMLTVLSQFMVTCPYCNTPYDSGEHPEGCPICFKTITGIEAFPSNGSNLVQLGRTPDISVVLVFKDTHREIAKDGYTIEGFLPSKLGSQTITVKFKEFSCTLQLEVVNAVKAIVCPKGHIYYPNENGTDTGCPFCVVEAEHLTVYYYDITYLSEILEVMYTEGVYYFDGGNYLTVRATKRDISLVSKIQKMFFKLTLLGRKRRFIFGGEVL